MSSERELRHALGNKQAENQALKSMINKAADRLEDVVEADCSSDEQEKALNTAKRLRTAVRLSDEKKQD